jgi:hypothetical protein
VLVQKRPNTHFLSTIKQAGFPLPEFVELSRRNSKSAAKAQRKAALQQLAERKLGGLRPWAWSPDSAELLQPLVANLTRGESGDLFQREWAQLYSKVWSVEFLRRFLAHRAREAWLCPPEDVGVRVDSLAGALAAIVAVRAGGHHRVVIKQAIGLAGSNALRLFEPELLETQRRWIVNSLAGGHSLVIEPWLERIVDFSVQLEMTPGVLKLVGYTGLLNDSKGQYQGNWAESHHHTRVPAAVIAPFRAAQNISRHILQLYAEIFAQLEKELQALKFQGPLGIDAFVYRDASGVARLKPVVEINPRYTMGRVMVELMRQVRQGSHGLYRLINRVTLRAAGIEDFSTYARALTERHPLQTEGEPPRIHEGALCLNDPAQAQVCLATLQVDRSLDVLLAGVTDVAGPAKKG